MVSYEQPGTFETALTLSFELTPVFGQLLVRSVRRDLLVRRARPCRALPVFGFPGNEQMTEQ